MSKKKKAKFRAKQSSTAAASAVAASAPVTLPPSIPLSAQDPVAVHTSMDFDTMEDKIRGEEILMQQENARIQEEQKIKKALNDKEVDRRLEQMRRQLGLKK